MAVTPEPTSAGGFLRGPVQPSEEDGTRTGCDPRAVGQSLGPGAARGGWGEHGGHARVPPLAPTAHPGAQHSTASATTGSFISP